MDWKVWIYQYLAILTFCMICGLDLMAQTSLSRADVYDYDIGDVIDTRETSYNTVRKIRMTVLDKYLIEDVMHFLIARVKITEQAWGNSSGRDTIIWPLLNPSDLVCDSLCTEGSFVHYDSSDPSEQAFSAYETNLSLDLDGRAMNRIRTSYQGADGHYGETTMTYIEGCGHLRSHYDSAEGDVTGNGLNTSLQYCYSAEGTYGTPFNFEGVPIEDRMPGPAFRIYPNPIVAGGPAFVNSDDLPFDLLIYSLEGRMLSRTKVDQIYVASGSYQLPSLDTGLYLLKFQSLHGTAVKRIIVP